MYICRHRVSLCFFLRVHRITYLAAISFVFLLYVLHDAYFIGGSVTVVIANPMVYIHCSLYTH